MHFAQPLADRRHKVVDEGEGVRRPVARLLLERGVLKRAAKIVENPSPRVALIGDGALNNEERGGIILCIDPNNLAQKLRRIGETTQA